MAKKRKCEICGYELKNGEDKICEICFEEIGKIGSEMDDEIGGALEKPNRRGRKNG